MNADQLESLETFINRQKTFYCCMCILKYTCFTDGYRVLTPCVCPITLCCSTGAGRGTLLVVRSGGRGLGNLFMAVANHVATS